ncbi:MAG: hypothetical protein ACKPKO_39785, partial [Candidatus Fonsibacter sp.]
MYDGGQLSSGVLVMRSAVWIPMMIEEGRRMLSAKEWKRTVIVKDSVYCGGRPVIHGAARCASSLGTCLCIVAQDRRGTG